MRSTPLEQAQVFVGVAEVPGDVSNPLITAMLRLYEEWPSGDDVPWCSAFVNFVCWLFGCEHSKRLNARSWLDVGTDIPLVEARPGWDVVVLSRGVNPAQGHVGFFLDLDTAGTRVRILAGNESNQVKAQVYDVGRVLGVRRLALEATPAYDRR